MKNRNASRPSDCSCRRRSTRGRPRKRIHRFGTCCRRHDCPASIHPDLRWASWREARDDVSSCARHASRPAESQGGACMARKCARPQRRAHRGAIAERDLRDLRRAARQLQRRQRVEGSCAAPVSMKSCRGLKAHALPRPGSPPVREAGRSRWRWRRLRRARGRTTGLIEHGFRHAGRQSLRMRNAPVVRTVRDGCAPDCCRCPGS